MRKMHMDKKKMRMDRKKRKKKILSGISWVYALIIYAFFYIPVIVMMVYSFNDSRNNIVWQGFTTKYYVKLMSDAELWKIFGNTMLIAVVSTVIAVVIGTMGAVGLKDAKFKGKGLISNSLYFPIVIPEIVLAVATLMLFSMANVKLSILTMILGNTTLLLPYIFITVKSRLVGIDPSIEEASLDLGANRAYTFMKITLPGIVPGVVSGAFMGFSLALEDLVISSFLADASTTNLSMKVYSMIKKGVSPEINALATLVFLVFVIGVAGYTIINTVRDKRLAAIQLPKDNY